MPEQQFIIVRYNAIIISIYTNIIYMYIYILYDVYNT